MERNSNKLSVCRMSKSQKIAKIKFKLEKSQETYDTVNLSKLPDKGEKLKSRIDELETLLKYLCINRDRCEVPIKNLWKHEDKSCKYFYEENYESFRTSRDLSKTSSYETQYLSKFAESGSRCPRCYPSGKKDPGGKIQLNETKSFVESAGSKNPSGLSSKPVNNVNEKNAKKIQDPFVTYPDDTLEEEAPEDLKSTLMNHQKRALACLLWREEQDLKGGVLVNDSRLDKTVTLTSLILKQKENSNYLISELEIYECKATLIICSASVIEKWKEEIEHHCNPDALEVHLYHGPKREKNLKNMRRYDVVLTTYNILMLEKKAIGNNNSDSSLFKVKWERIVLDEGHKIKNHESQTAQAVFALKGYRKWAAIGKCVLNDFKDLYSFLKFLQFAPFDDFKKFTLLTENLRALKQKNLLIKTILLRMEKEQVDE